jgi:hypothetical protein
MSGSKWLCLFVYSSPTSHSACPMKRFRHSLLVFILAWSGCGLAPPAQTPAGNRSSPVGDVVTATFGPDGRLWRLTPTAEYVYVDFSTDHGVSFSSPVAVNSEPQRIKAQPEDRPSLAVDRRGRVLVIYFADGPQPWTTYFSLSSDGGKHFSPSVPVSDHADTAKHYQDLLAVGPDGKIYVFWHDERDKAATGKVSLYYTLSSEPISGQFPNHQVVDSICDCCRTALDFDVSGTPVLFKRMVYPGSIRDHGLLTLTAGGTWTSRRVTNDDWQIDACPEHGPTLSIADDGRYHIAWFTQGRQRQGLFYAHSDDAGSNFSQPMSFGEIKALAGHASVLSLGQRVLLVWKEFDGKKTRIRMLQSPDRGNSWAPPRTLAESASASDHPFLLDDGETVFLSWNSKDHGYKLLPIPQQ